MMPLRQGAAALVLLACAFSAEAQYCSINITSDPPDAEVYFNGRPWGRTPVNYTHGHPVVLRVKLVKKGYKVWDREVDIGQNEVVGRHVVLEPLGRAGGGKPVRKE